MLGLAAKGYRYQVISFYLRSQARTDLTMRMVPRWDAGGGLAEQFSPHRGAETVFARLPIP